MTGATGPFSRLSKALRAPPPAPNTKLGLNTVQSRSLAVTADMASHLVRQ